jgi:hypothetical protein
LLLLTFNVCWMIVRIQKSTQLLTEKIHLTRAQLSEIKTHPQFLFVNTDKEFRDRAFSIWDTPHKYPLPNLIHKELVLTNSYRQTLNRFGIYDLMKELPFRANVLLFNRVDPQVREYYWATKGINVELRKGPPFRYLETFQVVLSQ